MDGERNPDHTERAWQSCSSHDAMTRGHTDLASPGMQQETEQASNPT